VAANGEFMVDDTDVVLPGFGVPFVFSRHYRSGVDFQSPLGYGWNHSFGRRLVSWLAAIPADPASAMPNMTTSYISTTS